MNTFYSPPVIAIQEIDVELRYTNIPVKTFDSSTAILGSSDSQSLAIWARGCIPTPIILLARPLRAAFEIAHTEFQGAYEGR